MKTKMFEAVDAIVGVTAFLLSMAAFAVALAAKTMFADESGGFGGSHVQRGLANDAELRDLGLQAGDIGHFLESFAVKR